MAECETPPVPQAFHFRAWFPWDEAHHCPLVLGLSEVTPAGVRCSGCALHPLPMPCGCRLLLLTGPYVALESRREIPPSPIPQNRSLNE